MKGDFKKYGLTNKTATQASSKALRIFARHDAPVPISASENVRIPPNFTNGAAIVRSSVSQVVST
jgi:hypothetical protein